MAISAEGYAQLGLIKDQAVVQTLRHILDRLALMQPAPIVGTLGGPAGPDTKPKLGLHDVGKTFYAADYDRVYQWTGTAWQDAPGQPARLSNQIFTGPAAPAPPAPAAVTTSPLASIATFRTAWAAASGQSIVASTPNGTVQEVKAPLILPFNNINRFFVRL